MLFLDEAGSPYVYEYSTVKSIQQATQNLLASPVVKASPTDTDRDGRAEEWTIIVQVRAPDSGLQLKRANVVVAFDYQTDYAVHMQMETMAVA